MAGLPPCLQRTVLYRLTFKLNAWGVVQLAERPVVTREVGGSNPSAPAIFLKAHIY